MLRPPAPLIGALYVRRESLDRTVQKETAESWHQGSEWKLDWSRPMRRKRIEGALQGAPHLFHVGVATIVIGQTVVGFR